MANTVRMTHDDLVKIWGGSIADTLAPKRGTVDISMKTVATLYRLNSELLIEWTPRCLSYLYVIQGGDVIKVGITDNPPRRLATLQLGSPLDLSFRQIHIAATRDWARKAEKACHRALKKAGRHRRGEWFNCTYEEAEDIIDKTVARYMHSGIFMPDEALERIAEFKQGNELALMAGIFPGEVDQAKENISTYLELCT